MSIFDWDKKNDGIEPEVNTGTEIKEDAMDYNNSDNSGRDCGWLRGNNGCG